MVSFILFILIFLLASPCGYALSRDDQITALNALTDSAMVCCACLSATGSYQLPGVEITGGEGGLPERVCLSSGDPAEMVEAIPPVPVSRNPFSALMWRASHPLDEAVRKWVSGHLWRRGDVLLSGCFIPSFPEDFSLASLIALVVASGDIEKVPVEVDMVVTGAGLSQPVKVTGAGYIRFSGGTLLIDTSQLKLKSY